MNPPHTDASWGANPSCSGHSGSSTWTSLGVMEHRHIGMTAATQLAHRPTYGPGGLPAPTVNHPDYSALARPDPHTLPQDLDTYCQISGSRHVSLSLSVSIFLSVALSLSLCLSLTMLLSLSLCLSLSVALFLSLNLSLCI